MPRRLPALAIAALGLTAIAGCGSTTVRHVTKTITRSTSTAVSASSTASTTSSTASSSRSTTSSSSSRSAPARSPVAGRPPAAVLAATARALRESGGYAMHAKLSQDGARVTIALTTSGGRAFDAAITTGPSRSEIVNVLGGSYLRGNASFWRGEGARSRAARARAARLANRWLRVPATARRSVTRSLGSLAPGVLARCLTEDHGTLRLAGHARIGGARALLVHDAGDRPGSTPSTVAVAATGPPYPLRYVAVGATRRGGRVDVCNDGKGGDAEGTITFDEFGRVPQVRAPQGAQAEPGAPQA